MRFSTVAGRFVLVDGDRALDVAAASAGLLPADAIAALQRWDDVLAWAPGADWSASVTVSADQFGPPVPAPRQVFAIALNYAPHAAEAGFEPPAEPLVFTKFPSCITGPVTVVELPEGNVDWEIEVVAVIGRGGYRIPREQAWDAVAGLTLGQDLSERVLQLTGKPPQFSLAKSHPGFGPVGPVAVTPDEFDERSDLGFESSIDGEVIQSGRTSEMIFGVDELIARLSAVCRLLPGDLIFTGTPEGVGNRRSPQRFLQPGETLVSRLEGVGELRQSFVAG
ncbi:fumarylacetoacetate hydrolase family protein [Jatrophihabitans telluris]|uniref:Fumarylacetoacetate hydrolase family protein n=1 Tax=Jatrophihabitans telluris TaxID=2038343 RepID=A0ABY4QV96_9ACTN|nr:fumarylacetoacetate hydrolase family protein [Jatrophihabitans telluris]UQX87400.1 fumarylacetoacetate hydrolase family protein [Jatrophihabitans telluris]